MKTKEQQRAADALERTKELLGKPPEFKRLYRAYVDRIGPAVIMNGLGQALATERAAAGPGPIGSASEQAHRELYRNLQRWLCRKDGVYPPGEKDITDDSDFLLKILMKKSESHYLHAQAEALAWLEWHKKSCRALLPKDEGTSREDEETSPTDDGAGE